MHVLQHYSTSQKKPTINNNSSGSSSNNNNNDEKEQFISFARFMKKVTKRLTKQRKNAKINKYCSWHFFSFTVSRAALRILHKMEALHQNRKINLLSHSPSDHNAHILTQMKHQSVYLCLEGNRFNYLWLYETISVFF